MLNMNRKSQIAIFMILGITAVILIGLAFYGVSNSTGKSVKAKQQQVEELFIGKGKYTTYIKSCLDQATKQGLQLIGKQGGAIYDSQTINGKPDKNSRYYEDEDGVKIHYALLAPEVSATGTGRKVPEYPFKNEIYTAISEPFLSSDIAVYGYTSFSTPFISALSDDPFIPLCDKNGPNSFHDSIDPYCGDAPKMFDSADIKDINSVQEYLESYITQKTDDCIKLESLPELQGYNIIKENMNVDIIIGETTVISRMNLSLSITVDETSPTIDISGITVEKNIRLKQMFDLLARIRQEDSKNIFFDVRNAAVLKNCGSDNDKSCLKPGMIVEKKLLPNKDYIITISDTESMIDGHKFDYQVVFQNRYPALDYITIDGLKMDNFDYDAILVEGMTLVIDPYGYDPDEDYYGSDNLMNYGYIYDFQSWLNGNFVNGYTEFKEDKDGDGALDCIFSGSENSNINSFLNGIKSCLVSTTAPSSFSSSSPASPLRKVTYKLGKKDIGARIIKIKVCDLMNQCDWQEIKILILPKDAFSTYDNSKGYIVEGKSLGVFQDSIVTLGKKQVIAQSIFFAPSGDEGSSDSIPTVPIAPEYSESPNSDIEHDTSPIQPIQPTESLSQQPTETQPLSSQQPTEMSTETMQSPVNNDEFDVLISKALEGTKLPYEMYYLDGRYVIVKNTVNNAGPFVVPETDEFRNFVEKGGNTFGYDAADGNKNLYINKKIYSVNQKSSVMTSLIPDKNVYFIYIPGPCTEGSFYKGYCHNEDICYFHMQVSNHNFKTVSKPCSKDKECTKDGCK
ncbi:MAG: hypothetical protein ABIG89_04420 [Candidatus Woesearchaeota archaeon]